MRSLALVGLALSLCGCGVAGSSVSSGADERLVARGTLSLRVPADWDSYSEDIGPWFPEPTMWAANVTLPKKATSWLAGPYEVLPELPPGVVVVMVIAAIDQGECPPAELRLRREDILTSYEGQPAPHVSTGSVGEGRDGRCLFAQAWFGDSRPQQAVVAAVNEVLASIHLGPEPPPGSGPGWTTYRDRKARVTLRYPRNWHVADRPLSPRLVEPRELVSLGTGALISGDERCPERPEAAVAALGPTDAFLSVLEFASPSEAEPRPKRLFPYLGAVGQTCTHPRLSDVLYRTQIFEDRGRVFQVYVAIADSASDETHRELAEILNSLTVDP